MKSILKKLGQRLLPIQNKIVFESRPDFACNAYPVFLKYREMYPKTKLVWAAKEKTDNRCHADVIIYYYSNKVFTKIKSAYHLYTAKAIVGTNVIPEKRRKDQLCLFLGHGSKTKHTKGYYEPGKVVDYVQVQSHFFDDITMDEYSCTRDMLVYLGYPRCDCFFSHNDKSTVLTDGKKAPYLIWLPTVRKRTSGVADVDQSGYDAIGMPLIDSMEKLEQFNAYLKKHAVYLLYKPHPSQDISRLTSRKLSHIRILTDRDLAEKDIQLYELIAESSALITDYSSVYYDYLLLNRPIATTTDDIEQWKEGRGFAFDVEKIYDESTTRVSDIKELEAFITSVMEGKDDKAAEREKYCRLTNMYRDGDSALRTVNFIEEKTKKR